MTFALVALLLTQAPEPAADTVLLFRSNDTVFEERLAAELHAAGFRVEVLDTPFDTNADIAAQLEQHTQTANALAAMKFVPRADGRIDLWVSNRVTSTVVTRTWDAPTTTHAQATLALEAVELLQASLVEIRFLPTRERKPSPPVVDAPVVPVGPRFREKPFRSHGTFGTGTGLFITPGGLRPQPLLEIQVGFAFSEAFAFDVQFGASVWPVHFDEPTGSADVGLGLIRVMGTFSPLRRGAFAVGLDVGTGLLLLSAAGSNPSGGLEARFDARAAWLIGGGLQASYRVNEGIRAQLLVNAGACLPGLGVRIGLESVATVGQPVFDGMLRFEFE